MPSDPLDIPEFLRRKPEDDEHHKAAWDRFMAQRKPRPAPTMPEYRRIPDLPTGAAPHDEDT